LDAQATTKMSGQLVASTAWAGTRTDSETGGVRPPAPTSLDTARQDDDMAAPAIMPGTDLIISFGAFIEVSSQPSKIGAANAELERVGRSGAPPRSASRRRPPARDPEAPPTVATLSAGP
jgi:hypothetical protein